MRSYAIALSLFAAGFSKVCDSEDKPSADVSARADVSAAASGNAAVKAALALARIGGTVTSAGDFSVELAVHRSGLAEALVSDASGKLVSDGVKLSALVQAKAGAAEKIELGFVPPRGRFEGRAKAGAELAAGPVDVNLEVGGKQLSGKLNAQVALPQPRLGGHLLAAGAFSAELLVNAGGEVLAFVTDSAGADVTADAGASFKAIVNAQGGARHEIDLAFDPPRACFAGKAKAGIALAPGPLEFVASAKVGGGIGRLESAGLSIDASHGGQIVAVGDYSVELVAKGNQLSAFVFDATGKAHAAGDLDLKLDVGAGAGTNLALKWDAPSLSYVGRAAANIDLSLQPIRVSLVASGKAFAGAVASLNAAAKASAKLKGKLDADAKLGADAKLDADAKLGANAKLAADAKAKLNQAAKAGASIKVTPPKIDVNKSASASAKAGSGKAGGEAKASAGFSFGSK